MTDTKPLTVLKSVGPKLVPFFKTVAIFFVLFGEESKPSVFCAVIKVLPIVSLIIFVLLHGMNLSIYYAYSRRILAGLIFSLLGDVFLVWSNLYFELGLLCFAIAQILYSFGFGWKPFNFYALTMFSVLGLVAFRNLLPGLEGIMQLLAPLYILIITTMGWRAIARVQFFDDLWTWTKLCGCTGALLFMVSDLLIGVNMFMFPVPFSHQLTMVTYYAAQLGIALSVVDSQVDVLLEKENAKKVSPF